MPTKSDDDARDKAQIEEDLNALQQRIGDAGAEATTADKVNPPAD